jgi:hypothetical protein
VIHLLVLQEAKPVVVDAAVVVVVAAAAAAAAADDDDDDDDDDNDVLKYSYFCIQETRSMRSIHCSYTTQQCWNPKSLA